MGTGCVKVGEEYLETHVEGERRKRETDGRRNERGEDDTQMGRGNRQTDGGAGAGGGRWPRMRPERNP